MRFTVITPVYNGAKYLEELILSVKNQDYFGEIEHIVINDGSNDANATQNIIDRYPHLIAKSRANLGQYATINEGITMATGEYLVVICADDLFMDNLVFSNVYRVLKERQSVNLIYGRTVRITESGQISDYNPIVIQEPFPKWRFKYQLPLLHCSAFVRRNFLITNNLLFDNINFKYAADWDWLLRITRLTEIEFIDLIISKYRVHANQTTNITSRNILKEEDILVLRKNNSSILLYYLIIYIERIRKAINILRNQGVKSLYKKIVLLIK